MNKRWRPWTNIVGSFSMRFAALLSLVFTVAVLLAGALSYILLSQELKTRLSNEARQMAENLAIVYQADGLEEVINAIDAGVMSTKDHSNLYLFLDNNLQKVAGNFELAAPFSGVKDISDSVIFSGEDREGNNQGEQYLAFGKKVSEGWIITARDTSWLVDSREVLIQSVAWGLGAALLLAVGTALFLAHQNERRIERLGAILDSAAFGDLGQRFAEPGRANDDITRIALQVNEVLGRLAQNIENLQQVTTDVAHDMRAPLTRLRTKLEPHYLRGDLPKDTQHDLQKAMSEMDTIVSTFDAILRLAQIESGSANIARLPVDLSAICLTMGEMLEPVAVELGHELTVNCGAEVLVNGDKDLLSQAIVNLIENAFNHCPAPALIELTTGITDAGAFFKVCDSGHGIEEQERTAVLQRFYRLEKSRSNAGNGLGLSLVNAIAIAHHGQITLSDNAPGLCATFKFSRNNESMIN